MKRLSTCVVTNEAQAYAMRADDWRLERLIARRRTAFAQAFATCGNRPVVGSGFQRGYC